MGMVSTQPRRLAPEVRAFAFLILIFSLYGLLGLTFGSYVGAPVSLLSLSLLFVFYGLLSISFCSGFLVLSRFSLPVPVFKPSVGLDGALIFLSLLGVLFLGVDRFFYRGINLFELNFAEMRALLNSENGRQGVSSIFSVCGNLFQLLYLLVVPRVIFYWEEYSSYSFLKLQMILALLAACLLASTYLLGGRTLLLQFVFICVGAALVRLFFRRSLVPFGIPKFWFLAGAVALLFLSVGIFWVRSQVFGGFDSADYLERLLRHVHPSSLDFSGIGIRDGGFYGDFANYMLCVCAYIFHQMWVLDAALTLAVREGSVLLLGLNALAPSVFGAISVSPMFRGLFFSAPAALYYDLGVLGVLIGSVGLSLLCLLFIIFFARSRISGFVFFPAFAAAAVLMSPIAYIMIMPFAILLVAMSVFVGFFLLFFSSLRRWLGGSKDNGFS